tara:strand:+ start:3636 stop:4187 length:552 start_codon:yes stop_codon:yes gene_type:complete
MRKKKINQGFTLIEIIIVIIVIAILGGVSAEIIGNASRIYSSTITKHKFLKQARYSFSKLKREITWQKKGQNFSGSNSKNINIISTEGRSFDYGITSSNKLIYSNDQIQNANNITIADNLEYDNSEIYFLDYSGNVVDPSFSSHLVKFVKLDFFYKDINHNIRLTGYSLPYNLRLGNAMSYHD